MSNPSYDYQQYVLANLPNDIAFNVNGKDGQFTFNKMKFTNFPDALHMKLYLQNNGYVDTGSQLSPPVRVSGAALSNNLVEGEQLTIATLASYSSNPTPTVDYRIQSRIPPSGAVTNHVTGDASIVFMLTSEHVGRQFRVQDRGTNSEGQTNFASGPWSDPVEAKPVGPEERILLSETEDLGFSAHSFLYQAVAPGDYGKLGEYWTGNLNINYTEFSSLKQRWDLNGVDRTGNYSGALVLTEIGDLETGLADPSSTQGIETLQYLYWYTLMAQSKGCKFVGIYIPHSPEGVNFDADALSKAQYWINWLTSKPEVTIPVYAIPVPVMVREMIEQFKAPPISIYADGLHLKTEVYGAPNQMNNAMGQMVKMFLTGERPENDPSWNTELVGLVDTAWDILQDYEMTGLGGSTVVAPYPVASDPLPNPSPLPS